MNGIGSAILPFPVEAPKLRLVVVGRDLLDLSSVPGCLFMDLLSPALLLFLQLMLHVLLLLLQLLLQLLLALRQLQLLLLLCHLQLGFLCVQLHLGALKLCTEVVDALLPRRHNIMGFDGKPHFSSLLRPVMVVPLAFWFGRRRPWGGNWRCRHCLWRRGWWHRWSHSTRHRRGSNGLWRPRRALRGRLGW